MPPLSSLRVPSLRDLPVPWKPRAPEPHSLRMRLALWYGGLLALALGLFGTLVLVLTTNAILESVAGSMRAEARVATLDVRRALTPSPPYWPGQLSLEAVDTYIHPGVTVVVVDRAGQIHYRSSDGTTESLPLASGALQSAYAGQTAWYDARVAGERVRAEVVPVRPPASGAPAGSGASEGVDGDGAPRGSEPVIGALVVAKSLRDVDETLALLRVLLLGTGLLTLAAALASGWVIAARVLQPLGEMAATARAIATSTARAPGGMRVSGLGRRVRRPPGQDELAQLVDTFNEMLAALERATATQRRFVADASHELRAPLTTVRGNLAFLRQHIDELPPEERRTMLADAHAETLRLARLVDDLLLLARADASGEEGSAASADRVRQPGAPGGETPAEGGSRAATGIASLPAARGAGRGGVVELDRVVLQLVRQLRGRLKAEGSPLSLEVGQIEPARVRADDETLRRIALILLDNAIKYTSKQPPVPPSGQASVQASGQASPQSEAQRPGRITVSLTREDGLAVLRVRDTGIGIDAADLPHLFERFYRADRARDRKGTGLGLAIARTLVEQIGGQIAAESTLGQGSTFSVRLPLVDG